ncbi:MAG: DinB family protein [Ferruginibacter sp.]
MEEQRIFIQMALHSWNTQVNSTTKLFEGLSDDQLMQEIAPGKNRGIYLLGHLTAYHDLMPEILGIGERTLPELSTIFLQIPDSTDAPMPSVAELRNHWKAVHERLDNAFAEIEHTDWFGRHNSMSDEDFVINPSRNKLSVLLNRTNHLSYHLGQLRLLN